MLTNQRLKELLHYDPETGLFTWISSTSKKRLAGLIAGSPDGRGYTNIAIEKKKYKSHRLAWLYMTGVLPKKEIDHIDGYPGNCAWNNLREASRQQNAYNTRAHKDGGSGIKGVSFDSSRNKWAANIMMDGKYYRLGRFATIESAAAAVRAKRIELHGAFARHE